MLKSSNIADRKAGFLQGIMLLLPITMPVVGVTVFTATVALMQDAFQTVPHADYLINFFQTMPGIWIFLFSPVAGWLADRFGRRTILLWSMLVYAFAGVAPFFLNDIYAILVTRCAVGICESVVLTVSTTMIGDYFSGRTRERWLASQTAVASLSAVAIVRIGGYLGRVYGWHGPFLVYLYSLFLAIGVALYCWEPAKGGAQTAVATDSATPADARFTVFPMARLLGICAITLLASIMFYTPITQSANSFVALGVTDPNKIGELSMYATIGAPLGTVLFWILNRLRIEWLLCLDFALIGIGFIGMGESQNVTSFIWATNAQEIGCGLILATLLVWASRGLAYEFRGRGTGMWQGAFAVGFFFSGATVTFLGKELGGLFGAFSMLGKVSLVAAALAVGARLIGGRTKPAVATSGDSTAMQ